MKSHITVITIPLGFVNAYLIRQGAQAILVDTGYRGSAGAIKRAAERYDVRRDMISLIILTHGHADHAGSAVALRDWCGAPIAVHSSDTYMVENGSNGILQPTSWQGTLIGFSGRLLSSSAQGFTPDLQLTGGEQLEPFGIEAHVLHTPGHTAGSVSIRTVENHLIIGDLLLKRARSVSQPFFMEDRGAWMESLCLVRDLEVSRYYAAHFGAFDRAAFEHGLRKMGLDG